MLSREETEARVGFAIPEEYWNFHPWGNRILVKRTPKEEVTKGGLFIPNTSQRKQSSGVVVKVGHTVGEVDDSFQTPGNVEVHPDFQGPDMMIGVVVTFGEFTGQSLEEGYEGDWVLLMAMDILGHNDE